MKATTKQLMKKTIIKKMSTIEQTIK